MIFVEQAGVLTLVQDGGRPGRSSWGVSPSGAADRRSYRRANLLVGNTADAGVLEIVAPGFACRFERDAVVALTGAPAPVDVDGEDIAFDDALTIRSGQRLALGASRWGQRIYLAVGGGVDADLVLGSRSTDVLGRLGAAVTNGARLHLGNDTAATAESPPDVEDRDAFGLSMTRPADPLDVPVVPTSAMDWIDEATLASGAWSVTPSSSRVAVLLTGDPVRRRVTEQFPPQGVVRGAVQVPADGKPLVFLADHPVTGGYPIVGVVPDAMTDVLAQLTPGHTVRLVVQP